MYYIQYYRATTDDNGQLVDFIEPGGTDSYLPLDGRLSLVTMASIGREHGQMLNDNLHKDYSHFAIMRGTIRQARQLLGKFRVQE